jgi:hypothetical protein
VSIRKWPIRPISALRENFNPRNINHMPAVKFFGRLDLDQIILFPDGYELTSIGLMAKNFLSYISMDVPSFLPGLNGLTSRLSISALATSMLKNFVVTMNELGRFVGRFFQPVISLLVSSR